MQQQKSIRHPATTKQREYIQALHRKGVLKELPKLDELSAGEASLLITRALQEHAKADVITAGKAAYENISEELDFIRLGLCIKLVYNKHEHNVMHPVGVQNFKKEVRQLYKVIGGLQEEMAAQDAASFFCRPTKHRIIVGDCKRVLKALPSESVHLIITSPPYNIGIGNGRWTDRLGPEGYLELTRTWLTECYRVLADGGKICVNLPANDDQSVAMLHLAFMKKLGFRLVSNIAWVKWDPTREEKFPVSYWRLRQMRFPPRKVHLLNVYESILVMQKGRGRTFIPPDLTPAEFQEWKYNVWFIRPLTDRTHPAPFPIELPKRLIKLYSLPGQTILDPFLGSGTTMKACMQLRRNCIGVEMNPEYVEMTKQRLAGYDQAHAGWR